MKRPIWLFYGIIILAALSVAVATRAATTLWSTYVAGTGFVQAVNEAPVQGTDITGPTTMQVRVAAVPGQTVAGTVYTVTVRLDTGVVSSAPVSWTTQEVNSGAVKSVVVSGLTGLLAANNWAIQTSR